MRRNRETELKEAKERFEYSTKYHCRCAKESQKEFFDETLRDQLAIAAMNGMLAGSFGSLDPSRNKNWANNLAKQSYKVADAMLKARSKDDNSADD